MAVCRWKGTAAKVAQVNTVTPASVTVGNTFTVTINGKAVTVTATAATVANVTGLMTTAFNASTEPEFAEITAVDSTTTVTLTHDTAGVSFTQTSSSATGSGSAGHSFTTATATAASGPNHWSTAANWSGGAVPVNSDSVYIEDSDVDILYGLDQSAVTVTLLSIAASYTGEIGLRRYNGTGTSQYLEYRSIYLAIGATTLTIGEGEGNGSGLLRIDAGSVQTTLRVLKTDTPSETNAESLLWKGTHASNDVTISRGSAGLAVRTGDSAVETATVATLRVGYISNQAGDATVRCGSGVTLTTVSQSGGTLTTASAITTLGKTSGVTTLLAGAITTLDADGGETYQLGTGTITTLNVSGGATVDFSRDTRAKTVTTPNLFAGATLLDPHGVVTWTNGIDLTRCSLADVTLDIGNHKNMTLTNA